ncbi:hypothetical protein LEP1GSC036_0466 [Leptospira weilii str. 2006001853]|uniref:Uncharacterized protein n=1 Tax=Leptospira weilii str. 2006001853 TaxID=1001589 RepID=A0A828Z585_9LEPT|nr:hypothetical protein [Leptospira weilii]EKR65072.1 hypothetical protein LEP1GSC036_0466 [Leptospira weilii str. 2006001853]EMJ64065.1 hypothetical protein LEP1GSC051_4497 [Leptospira sp. P2653]EMN44809.1 hypothetical protein LEP1GSC086_0679 [Leptospira weilii str. LNT 1234]QDK26004.1 hypothetical protein FHG68_04250 [Leptospira weilii]
MIRDQKAEVITRFNNRNNNSLFSSDKLSIFISFANKNEHDKIKNGMIFFIVYNWIPFLLQTPT